MRTWIQNGTIVDGTGGRPYRADILIQDGRISEIGAGNPSAADEIVDAGGLLITPAFIDSHRHCDFAVFRDADFGLAELSQGIGSVLCGNCGLTPYPSADENRREYYDFLEPCLGPAPEGMAFADFPVFRGALEKVPLPVNMGALVGTGAVKTVVKGFSPAPFTGRELDLARGLIEEAMAAGAFGVSMGIMYTPECFSSTKELAALAKAAGRHNGAFSCHIRGEGDHLVESVKEAIEIGRLAGTPVNISHFKATGLSNWGTAIKQAIEVIEDARAGGEAVTVDFYPYTGGATTLLSLLPPTILRGSVEETLRALEKPDAADFLKRELYREHAGWDNMVTAIGWERIVISGVTKPGNHRFVGKSVAEIMEESGKSDGVDVMLPLLLEELGKVGIIVMSMSQEDVDLVAGLPYSGLISDSLYGTGDFAHPRLFGSFPKFLREYVAEKKQLTIEQAVHKMTGMTADRFRIPDRGFVKKGYAADLNLFSLGEFRDKATFAVPKQLAAGMRRVLLQGRTVWKDREVSEKVGQILIHSK